MTKKKVLWLSCAVLAVFLVSCESLAENMEQNRLRQAEAERAQRLEDLWRSGNSETGSGLTNWVGNVIELIEGENEHNLTFADKVKWLRRASSISINNNRTDLLPQIRACGSRVFNSVPLENIYPPPQLSQNESDYSLGENTISAQYFFIKTGK